MPADLTQVPAALYLMAQTTGMCNLEAPHPVGPRV